MKPKPLSLESAEAEKAVCDLRASGLTFEEIAQRLGMSSKGQAHKVYQRALLRIPAESVEDLRSLEADRLDALTRSLWSQAESGDTKAVGLVLRIMERRARLFGLDAPARQETKVEKVWEQTGIDKEIEQLVEKMGYLSGLVDEGVIELPEHLRGEVA